MTPQRARKKPVEIEFMVWSGKVEDAHPIIQWVNATDSTAVWREHQAYSSGGLFPQEAREYVAEGIYIRTLEGKMHVSAGDVVIRGVQGEFYPCKPDIFEATYDVLESEQL